MGFAVPGAEGLRASFARRFGIWLFSVVLSAVCRQRVTDPTSGFRLCNRRAIELFARDYPHDYPEVESILMIHAHRLRAREVPVQMHPRRDGRSSITSGESIYYMVKVLLAIFVGLFRRRPVVDPGVEAPVAAERGIRDGALMQTKLQIVAILASSMLVVIVFELLRRRRLIERYALLWLFSSLVLLGLSVWTGLLEVISDAVGIVYPPNALFMIAFAFVLVLLLHFSIAISRLSGETKVLAQKVARLDKEVRDLAATEKRDEVTAAAAEVERADPPIVS